MQYLFIYKIIILGPGELMAYLTTNENNVKEVIKIHPMGIKNDIVPEGMCGLVRMDFDINVLG
jgi:hypothetical protein